MDFKQIQELIKLVNRTKISELKIQDKEFKIVIRSKSYTEAIQQKVDAPTAPAITLNTQQAGAPPALAHEPAPAAVENTDVPATETAAESAAAAAPESGGNLIEVKSPMIGTFYRSSSPDKDPFVKVGDQISKGSVVCIIEAMKLFNEIESEVEGKVVKVLVENSTPVEYDQPLFLIEPA